VPVDGPDEEIEQLDAIDPAVQAVIDRSAFPVEKLAYDSAGTIDLVEYRPDFLRYESSSPEEGFAVFSEIFYPEGWNAAIDGEPAEIKRVNYILRGMEIPAGDHNITFEFRPASYYTGNKIMLVFSLGTILFLFMTSYYSMRRSQDVS
jgi:hypothetical protein